MKLVGSPRSFAELIPTGRIWPSGDFGLGTRRSEPDSRVSLDSMEHWHQTGALEPLEAGAVGRYGIPLPGSEVGAEPLNLTSAPNSHSAPEPRAKRGLKGITGYGKKMIKSALALLERPKTYRLTFCTITMPTLPLEGRQSLAGCWPEFLRQLLQHLSRILERQGLPTVIVSATEIQPQRLTNGHEGYLHLHLVWPNIQARYGSWAVDALEFRSWCESFLDARGLLPSGGWVNVNVQRVKKSAAGYIAKYISKGGDVLQAFIDDLGVEAVPSTWWNMTKTARDSVKANMLEGDSVGQLLRTVVDYTFDCDDFGAFVYLRHAEMFYDGRLITIGWYGVLTEDARRQLTSMLTVDNIEN